MNRRSFLSLIGLGAAAAAVPTKAYSFLGNILRPRPDLIYPPTLRLNGGVPVEPGALYMFQLDKRIGIYMADATGAFHRMGLREIQELTP